MLVVRVYTLTLVKFVINVLWQLLCHGNAAADAVFVDAPVLR